MKLKNLWFLLLFISSFSLHADWVTTNIYTLDDTDEPFYIATAIERDFVSLRNFLVGLNFAYPHKAILTQLSGRIDSVKWENDETCQVPNPEVIESFILTNVDFRSYWSDKPEEIDPGFMHEFLIYSNPCNQSNAKTQIKRTTYFNNKRHTIYLQQ